MSRALTDAVYAMRGAATAPCKGCGRAIGDGLVRSPHYNANHGMRLDHTYYQRPYLPWWQLCAKAQAFEPLVACGIECLLVAYEMGALP